MHTGDTWHGGSGVTQLWGIRCNAVRKRVRIGSCGVDQVACVCGRRRTGWWWALRGTVDLWGSITNSDLNWVSYDLESEPWCFSSIVGTIRENACLPWKGSRARRLAVTAGGLCVWEYLACSCAGLVRFTDDGRRTGDTGDVALGVTRGR